MIVPDTNLLLYAYDSASPFHRTAATWWKHALSGSDIVGLIDAVILGFVRIGTNTRAFQNPMGTAEAVGHVRAWLAQPNVELLDPAPDLIQKVLELVEHVGTAGNLVTDAQIAATALHYDAVVHTADTDFMRFGNLRWFNPITETRSRPGKR